MTSWMYLPPHYRLLTLPFPFFSFSSTLLSLQFTLLYLIYFPHLSSLHSSEMSISFSISIWPARRISNAMKIFSLSIFPYLMMSAKRPSSDAQTSISTVMRRSSLVLTMEKALNFLYATFANAIAKRCWSPCPSRSTITAMDWWTILVRFTSIQLLARWTI